MEIRINEFTCEGVKLCSGCKDEGKKELCEHTLIHQELRFSHV